MTDVKFKKLRPDAVLPEYKTEFAAGADLTILVDEDMFLCSGFAAEAFSTGLACEIPPGFELELRPRSSLHKNFEVLIPNSPGTIDSDFRGEIKVLLLPSGMSGADIPAGKHRVAQLVLKRAPQMNIIEVDELSDTRRGAGGFGSTGES